jgi:serralysin
VDEANETFFVNLSNPTNAIISDSQGVGTIVDDDNPPPLPSLRISDVSLTEGNSGARSFLFRVTLSAASPQTVTVAYATANGTATVADRDYQARSGTVSFAPGQTSKTIIVLVNGDLRVEANETFFVNLSNPTNATLADSQGRGIIRNDDAGTTLTGSNFAIRTSLNDGQPPDFSASWSGDSEGGLPWRHGRGRRTKR